MTAESRPEWLSVLITECARSGSQTKVAEILRHGARTGFPSAGTLSQVIAGKYPSDLKRIQALVEGAFMGKTVRCPVIGELSRSICMEYQVRPFAATNAIRVQLNKDGACKGCPNRRQP